MKEIGIKLADGSFYPILSSEVSSQKIELTTVRDNQETVQIDLFQKDEELEYIGSLIVEDITKKSAGDSTIELLLEIDNDNNLRAEAADVDSGASQALKVSLTAVDSVVASNDFSLNDLGSDFSSISSENQITQETSEDIFEDEPESKSKLPFIIGGILGVIALIVAVALLSRSCSSKKVVETKKIKNEVASSTTTTDKAPTPSSKDTQGITSGGTSSSTGTANSGTSGSSGSTTTGTLGSSGSTTTGSQGSSGGTTTGTQGSSGSTTTGTLGTSGGTTTGSQGSSGSTTTGTSGTIGSTTTNNQGSSTQTTSTGNARLQTNPDGSVKYLLQWGDTLWDLAETFYKNPWDYVRIVKHNNIQNPNLVIAGTYIEIPAK